MSVSLTASDRLSSRPQDSCTLIIDGEEYEMTYERGTAKLALDETDWLELIDRTGAFFRSFDKSISAGNQDMWIDFKARKFHQLSCLKEGERDVSKAIPYEKAALQAKAISTAHIPFDRAVRDLEDSIGTLEERISPRSETERERSERERSLGSRTITHLRDDLGHSAHSSFDARDTHSHTRTDEHATDSRRSEIRDSALLASNAASLSGHVHAASKLPATALPATFTHLPGDADVARQALSLSSPSLTRTLSAPASRDTRTESREALPSKLELPAISPALIRTPSMPAANAVEAESTKRSALDPVIGSRTDLPQSETLANAPTHIAVLDSGGSSRTPAPTDRPAALTDTSRSLNLDTGPGLKAQDEQARALLSAQLEQAQAQSQAQAAANQQIIQVLQQADAKWIPQANIFDALAAAHDIPEEQTRNAIAQNLNDTFLADPNFDQVFTALKNARTIAKNPHPSLREPALAWTTAITNVVAQAATEDGSPWKAEHAQAAARKALDDMATKPGTDEEGLKMRRLMLKLLQATVKDGKAALLPLDVCQLYSTITQRPIVLADAGEGRFFTTKVTNQAPPFTYIQQNGTQISLYADQMLRKAKPADREELSVPGTPKRTIMDKRPELFADSDSAITRVKIKHKKKAPLSH